MAYEEVKPMGTAKAFSNEGQVVEGILEEVRENIGPNENTIYKINGQEYWGTNALNPLMGSVAVGSKVRITLLSLSHKFPNGRVGKNFKVEVDRA